MKTPKMFIPEKDSEPKIEQLLEAPKLPQPEERYRPEIERMTRKDHQTYEFLLSDSEIFRVLEKLPARDVEGLEKIVITCPLSNEDYKKYGRYVPGKIYLFRHQKSNGKFEIVVGGDEGTKRLTPEEFKIENYKTLLHETGHHVGIMVFDDGSEEFANGYMRKRYEELGDIFR